MSIHTGRHHPAKKKKKPKLHGTRLPTAAMKDVWGHKAQAKGQ